MRSNLEELPKNIPCPVDDGSTNHLVGCGMPNVKLHSTLGTIVDFSQEFQEASVLFIYPRAGSPLEPNSNPELWDTIPGARGCTPQSCGFRDLKNEFNSLGIKIYGLSTQSTSVQREFVKRNHITFPILSDSRYEFVNGLNLPTFEFEGERLVKRMSFYIEKGTIKKVFYPVFPPDKNAAEVLAWLQ